jgi:hypothetical protein
VLVGTVRGNSHWLANLDAAHATGVWLGGSRRTGDATVHHQGFIDVAAIEVDPDAGAPST